MRKDFVRIMTGVLSVGLVLGVLPNQMYGSEHVDVQETGQEVFVESTTTSVSPEIRYTMGFREGDYNYEILSQEDKTVQINMYLPGKESESELYIPHEVEFDGETYTVTSIGSNAFGRCDKLTGSLIIPSTITDIGENAFRGCSGLTGDLIISDSVINIGESAFGECTGLNGKISIPNSVINIGYGAFEECSGLTGDLMIPDSVIAIGAAAFMGCTSLEGELVLSNNIKVIERNTFRDCSSLTGNLTIPEGVTAIGDYAFDKCSELTGDLIIPEGVISIGMTAFGSCKGFTGELILPNSITSIDRGAFTSCKNLKSITIPFNLSNVGDIVFLTCEGLESIKLNYGELDIKDKGYNEWKKFITEIMKINESKIELGYLFNNVETKQVKGPGIEIPDTEAPVLHYVGKSTITIEEGADFTLPEVTITDNKDESVPVTCIIKNSSAEVISAIDTSVKGTYTLTYSAIDEQGNEAVPLVITVVVKEAIEAAEVIQFKDYAFKQVLIDSGVDKNEDGEITVKEMEQITHLNISGKQIKDISGIEYAINIVELDLGHNEITDISLLPIKKYSSLRLEDNDLDIKENSQSMQIIDQIQALGSQVIYTPQRGSISNNANLSYLVTNRGNLSPVFNKEITAYTMTVGYSTQSITVEGTVEDQKSSLEGIGNTDLKVGKNTIQIVVTAEDQTTKIYTIVITREAPYPTGGLVSEGSSDDIEEPTIEKVLESLEVKEDVINDFKVYVPYTSLNNGLTLDRLKKLTNNKLTDKQLQEIIETPELLKKLGIEEAMLSNQIALNPVKEAKFKDISQEHWASDSIKLAAELGLVVGMQNNKFEPKAALQVADTFSFLDRTLLLNDVTEMKLSRTTVEKYVKDKEHWAFVHVASVASKLSEETLKVISELGDQPIQRQLLAQVLYEITENKIESSREQILFEDIKESPYEEAINYCTKVGLLNGVDSAHMAPEKELTRAELISVLIRLNDLLK